MLEHAKRLKLARDVLKSHVGGNTTLHKTIEADSSYASADTADREKTVKEADERFSTFTCLENSDKAKHGSVVSGLNSQKSLKNDQFPKTLIDGHDTLSNYPWDNSKKLKNKNNNNENNEKEKEEETPQMFAQNKKNISCFCCGKKVTMAKSMPRKTLSTKKIGGVCKLKTRHLWIN